jgi:hypothetical protein
MFKELIFHSYQSHVGPRPTLLPTSSLAITTEITPLPQPHCRMDLPGPTTSAGTRTDYSVGPWDYLTYAERYLMA